jgi:Mg2+/citrate symporter
VSGKRKIVTEEQRKQLSNKQKMSKEAMEYASNPHRSYWPFALALALFFMLLGVVVHPIVFWIGLVLVAGAIIGWRLERH